MALSPFDETLGTQLRPPHGPDFAAAVCGRVCELGSIGRTAERELMALTNNWAVRRIELVARDFSSLPVTARLLVDHLTARAAATDSAPVST